MKKLISVILLFAAVCSLLSGCTIRTTEPAATTKATSRAVTTPTTSTASKTSATTTPEPTTVTATEAPAPVDVAFPHGKSMVSDGEYIYFCPPEPSYSYRYHFGADRSRRDSFVCSLCRVSVADAAEDPLGHMEVLAGSNCRWLCLRDGYVYFVDEDEGAICRVPCDGGSVEIILAADDAFNRFRELLFVGDDLYFTQYHALKRIRPDAGEAAPETVFEINEEFSAFAAETSGVDFRVDGVLTGLYACEYYDGQIYLIAASGEDYDNEFHCLLRIDPDDFSYEIVCADTSTDLALCDGRLYYQKVCGESISGDPLLCLMALDGASTVKISVVTDSRGLFTDGEKVYYDNYVDTTEAYFAYLDGNGEEPEYGFVDDRLLFAYDKINGEQWLPIDSPVMYIDGVAGNILWYEYFADHVWMTLDGSTVIYMAEEYVRDDSEYGPGTSSLDLDANDLSACFRLIRTDGEEEFRVFLNPHESRTMTFPCGKYILKIAEGETWISDTEAFGVNGDYSTTDYFSFQAGSSYYIGSGTRGDFRGDNASGFLN